MIRNDFVSNSSSTSFMIVGYCVDSTKIEKRGRELDIYNPDMFLEDNCEELIEKMGAKIKVKVDLNDYPDFGYFGLNYEDMKRNETREDFERRILVEVQKIFPEATLKDIKYECQGGYDG